MHLAVVDAYSYIAGIAACQRTLFHTVHKPLDYGRNKPGINGTTNNTVVDHKFATP